MNMVVMECRGHSCFCFSKFGGREETFLEKGESPDTGWEEVLVGVFGWLTSFILFERTFQENLLA